MNSPRAQALVDLGAIKHNVEVLRTIAGVPVMAVVKADAYGHGLIPVARAAVAGGATWIGTALLEEGLALRAAGIDVRVMSWLTPPGDRFEEAIVTDIDLSAGSVGLLQEIASAAQKSGKPARVHLEVDTGMTRGGALGELNDLLVSMKQAVESGHVIFAGIWSHFARADEPSAIANDQQRGVFEAAVRAAADLGLNPEVRHLSNSAATLVDEKSRFDLVRCGIAMYGLSPDVETLGAAGKFGLRPAMKLTARLALVKDVPAGREVSYGGTFVTTAPTKIGILPLGYADGIPRRGGSQLRVQSREGLHPVIGRVCMDQVILDLGADSTLGEGDEVICFGSQEVSADQWGQWAGTIGYEIVTRLGVRIPRIYSPDFHS